MSRPSFLLRAATFVVFAVSTAALAVACDGVTVVDVTEYDQTCKEDADCVAVKNGDICCGCPDAAINKSDHQRYKDDLGTCAAVCEIACVGNEIPVCENGKCGLKQ